MEYGFWSIVPPLVTIALALAIKNVFIALIIGIFLASWILADFHLFTGINDTFYSLVHTFESNSNTIVLMSMLLIGALIYLIERSGGIEGFVDIMVKKRGVIKSKRAAGYRGVHLRLPELYGHRLCGPPLKRQHEALP